ncbi:RNA-dependent RNA polymerase [Heterobasidion mitovirus 2]|uniref:RNA-dependent RNA polymerase n=1 Tax=Heterobasidion mitovirus 2 TaxID=2603542 RepID=A0ABX5YET3_9VIRU|nr:RNA-dependent RNA polymerase [Heterobasidion mitovirus 2]QED55404.1 RNA-dependent RNA polymerase [Heterobasidion mitovirus 2]
MSLLRRLCKVAQIILTQFGVVSSNESRFLVGRTYVLLSKRLEQRGLADMIAYNKSMRNYIMRYLLGNPILKSTDNIALHADGFPKDYHYMKPLLSSTEGIRAVMTVLTVTRAFSLPAEPNLATITQPSGMLDGVITDQDLAAAYRKLHVRAGIVKDWTDPHFSTKKGPQGQALLTSLSELTLLSPELLQYIKVIGGKSLSNLIDENLEGLDILERIKPKGFKPTKTGGYFSIAEWWKWLFPTKSKNLRKISYFGDKEGKTRVIAIFDYWSQTSLKPLHNCINSLLRAIPMDMTFNQGAFTQARLTPIPGHMLHSIDLTAATDRMPIALQRRVVEHLFNSAEKAAAWTELMVGQDFKVVLPSKEVLTVKYAAGQPMGAYSSWPTMALTHHIIVQIAAMRAGVSHRLTISGKPNMEAFRDYILLGDDLRIDHDLVAREYKILISKLGMPYSEAKTHDSYHGFEFAKRWFYHGEEVTGFSISGLLSVWKSYPLLINFLDNQASHGWKLPLERHPDLILQLHKLIKGDSFIYNKTHSMIKLYKLFHWVRDIKNISTFTEERILEIMVNILEILNSEFGIRPLDKALILQRARETLEQVYSESKRNLVEKDLLTFQKEAYRVNARLNNFLKDRLKEARVDQTTRDFLLETVSVVLNWNNPIVMCLNRLIDQSINFLTNYWDPDVSSDFLFREGLSKYSITKGIFSMRSSTSITLAESAILKESLTVFRKRFQSDVGLLPTETKERDLSTASDGINTISKVP